MMEDNQACLGRRPARALQSSSEAPTKRREEKRTTYHHQKEREKSYIFVKYVTPLLDSGIKALAQEEKERERRTKEAALMMMMKREKERKEEAYLLAFNRILPWHANRSLKKQQEKNALSNIFTNDDDASRDN